MSRASSRIKRKYCRLHGWAPHMFRAMGEGRPSGCCRCIGVPGMTRTEKIKAFLRGFKLPRSVKARNFVGDRFQN